MNPRWQKIMADEIASTSLSINEELDDYVLSVIRSSYSKELTLSDVGLREIITGAKNAGYSLVRRRYSTQNCYVLAKDYPEFKCSIIFQFSTQPNTFMVAEVCYGAGGLQYIPTAPKSKLFPKLFNCYDFNKPLSYDDFIVDIKLNTEDTNHLTISTVYESWTDYFNFCFNFMAIMVYKTKDINDNNVVEEVNEPEQEAVTPSIPIEWEYNELSKALKDLHPDITIDVRVGNRLNVIHIHWDNVIPELKDSLNNIIDNFVMENDVVDIDRVRTHLYYDKTITIKQ